MSVTDRHPLPWKWTHIPAKPGKIADGPHAEKNILSDANGGEIASFPSESASPFAVDVAEFIVNRLNER